MEQTQKLKQAVTDYQKGRKEAFTTLYEESSKYIYTCIYQVMSGNDNAMDVTADIMQETYMEISRSIGQLESEDKFLSWAGRIANRKCYAYLKKNKKYVLLNEEDDTFDNFSDSEGIIPEAVMQDREKQRLVREIIDTQLTEMQKMCIVAYYYNEQKQSEIAQEFGIPENTVKTNLSRAKAKIKEGVLDLEKKEGTKLYSVAPLLLLLFKEDVKAASVPEILSQNILSTASASAGAASKGVIGKIASASLKTKIIASIAVVGVVGGTVILGQGYNNSTNQNATASIETISSTEVKETEVASEIPVETETTEEVVDKYAISEDDYVDAGDFIGVLKRGEPNPDTLMDVTTFEKYIEFFYLPESIDLYSHDGYIAGYTKPDIELQTYSKTDDWYEIIINGKSRLVKADEFNKVAIKRELDLYDEDNTTSTSTTASTSQTTQNTQTETSNTNVEPEPVAELPQEAAPQEEVPVESEKYTPEEAFNLLKSSLEGSGVAWNPSIKEFSSYCSSWIPLDKNKCNEYAAGSVYDFSIGDTVGNPYKNFYIEVTGSDESYVYIITWFCS